MAKKPIKPLIRALAEHIADDVMAAHDAGYPRRKRLPKEYWEKELAKEEPLAERGKNHDREREGKSE